MNKIIYTNRNSHKAKLVLRTPEGKEIDIPANKIEIVHKAGEFAWAKITVNMLDGSDLVINTTMTEEQIERIIKLKEKK